MTASERLMRTDTGTRSGNDNLRLNRRCARAQSKRQATRDERDCAIARVTQESAANFRIAAMTTLDGDGETPSSGGNNDVAR